MKIFPLFSLVLIFLTMLSGCSSVTVVSEYSVYEDLEDNYSSKGDVSEQSDKSHTSVLESENAGETSGSGPAGNLEVSESSDSDTDEIADGPINTPVEITEFSKNQVEFIGRFSKENSGYRFCWSGSTISAGFNGTEIAVNIELSYIMPNKGNSDYMEVFIDGKRYDTLRITKFDNYYVVAEGLEKGYHYISLVKRTEGCFSTLTFNGFDYLSGKAELAPARSERRIEFLGDSITAGYGNMASGGSIGFKMSQEDATNSYAYMTAKALGAEATIIASSGNGLTIKNLDPAIIPGNELMNFTVLNKNVEYNFSSVKQPDILVINFGANDFAQGCDSAEYREKYHKLLDMVRTVYPETYIVCAIGTHSVSSAYPHIQTVVRERVSAGDNRIASFKFSVSISQKGMSGADNHPSSECHKIMAEELSYFLSDNLGW